MRPTDSRLTGPRFIPPQAQNLLVLLHGYGADGNDLFGLAAELKPHLPHTAIISLDAPEAGEMGYGRQWFSLAGWGGADTLAQVAARIPAAQDKLMHEINSLMAEFNVKPERTALLGFSQGCMMALQVGLRMPHQCAGIIGFSGLLAAPQTLSHELKAKPPVLLIHGTADEVVPYSALREAEAALLALDIQVTAISRPGLGHGIDGVGLSAAVAFLQKNFKA